MIIRNITHNYFKRRKKARAEIREWADALSGDRHRSKIADRIIATDRGKVNEIDKEV